MSILLENFHFLRPYWLFFLIPVVLFWLAYRRSQDQGYQFGNLIAPHLLVHLIQQADDKNSARPMQMLICLWVLLIFAISGPSWQLKPTPFAEDRAGLMILIKLDPSMESRDLQPSRLERVGHKLHDLFEIRPDGSAGLIAYSGSSHLVVPLTQDEEIVEQMAGALSPSIMPRSGDVVAEALEVAVDQFTRRKSSGSILLITDSVDPAQLPALAEFRKNFGTPVQILAAVPSREHLASNGIEKAATTLNAQLSLMTVDETDIRRIIRHAESQVTAAVPEGENIQWQDNGYKLIPVILLCLLVWSRRGFQLRWER